MNVVNDYRDLSVGKVQRARLYMQARPLSRLWRFKRKSIDHELPEDIDLIDKELVSDYISIDCAGWYFTNQQRNCIAIEIDPLAESLWFDVKFEYDYLEWRPTYLDDLSVLAYYSTYFKYCKLSEFINFCKVWSSAHRKVIVGVDPTKIKFNYLKHSLVNILKNHMNLRVLIDQPCNLLFVIES